MIKILYVDTPQLFSWNIYFSDAEMKAISPQLLADVSQNITYAETEIEKLEAMEWFIRNAIKNLRGEPYVG